MLTGDGCTSGPGDLGSNHRSSADTRADPLGLSSRGGALQRAQSIAVAETCAKQEHLCSLGVDSRQQDSIVSAADTMAQPTDLLPGTLDLLILRTVQNDALHGWAISERTRSAAS
jgi:hypothetical protein